MYMWHELAAWLSSKLLQFSCLFIMEWHAEKSATFYLGAVWQMARKQDYYCPSERSTKSDSFLFAWWDWKEHHMFPARQQDFPLSRDRQSFSGMWWIHFDHLDLAFAIPWYPLYGHVIVVHERMTNSVKWGAEWQIRGHLECLCGFST